MTRYPVHVGSIPAYQLREMDRLNEPYRKERPMTDDPGEREALIEEDENLVLLRRLDEWDEVGRYAPGPLIRWAAAALRGCIALSPDPVSEPVEPEDACRHGYMTGTFCSECPGEVASRPVSEPVDGLHQKADLLQRAETLAEPDVKLVRLADVHAIIDEALSPDPVSEPVDGLRAAIDAVADALNGWDQGEEPREDTHRHWSRIVAALAAAPAEERGVDVERLLTAMASVEFKATGLPMDVSMTAKARKVAQEYAALTDGLVHDPTYADAVWDAARQSGDPR